MQKILISILVVAGLMLSACSAVPIPGVHKIDIQQGNVITQEMVAKLKPGMDKSQVRFALGTPTLIDVFHQDRWDYIYSIQPGGEERQQRRLAVFFENDRLVRVEGDVKPGTGESSEPAPAPEETTVTVTPAEKKKGFFSGLKGAIGLGKEEDLARTPAGAQASGADEPAPKPEGAATPAPDAP